MDNQKLTIYSNLKRYQLSLDRNKTITFGYDNQDSTLFSFIYEEGWQLSDGERKRQLHKGKIIKDAVNEIELLLHDTFAYEIYDTLGKDEIIIGYAAGATLQLSLPDIQLLLRKTKRKWLLSILGSGIYVNNYYKEGKEILLEKGDEISFLDHTLKIFEKEIFATEGLVKTALLSKVYTSRYDFYEDYPDFHRSPRIIYRVPEKKHVVKIPPEVPKKPTDGILKMILPPLIMLSVTILVAILMPRQGLYMIASAATTVVTIIFSISGYLKSRKEYKQEIIERKENYEDYLSKKAIELYEVNQQQKDGQLYHYPDISELLEMGEMYHHRIYEKTPLHFDFLYYRLGLGELESSSEITYSNKEREKKGDDLEKQGYLLYETNLKISGMPIVANLVHGPMGYIGPRKLVIRQLQLLVNQLAVFHSYHDLQFIIIFPEEELKDWNWMRWFPHATLQDMNVRGLVYNQRSRDQVLGSLNQILKNRKNAMDEKRSTSESTIFTPHYVIMVTDEKLILDHVIMEFLNEDPTALGCSVIFVQDVMSSLSENVKTVVDIRDRNTGVLVMEEGNLKNTSFLLDHFPEKFDKEELPRLLAPINHLQNLKSSIPERITFMQMYGVDRFEELQIKKRWSEHSPHKSLAVPLGLRGQGDVVYLNLHEKAHGPHGLVAGTTGSGKSEIIQSYIISLAVNFHPHDVAFLLIDYKGGGMANLFTDLPHLLGTITNLDGTQSMRALVSINAELKRRQRLFLENDVNHINQYQKLYKNGDITAPMPHLFLISDEFAELKAEQPEFMNELVSTARIGRSLGIHLILATQKPSGVVNDQIWSNSKFKLALKVANKADSMEMLKTPDAAEITQAGRAYLQVGNNEVYELFQSAWSGADYQPDKEEQNIEDHTIYRINDLGQYEILSEDLSGLENADEVKQIPTELDVVVNGIRDMVKRAGIVPLPRPWLPPLADRIYLPELHPVDFQQTWKEPKQPLMPIVGIVDIPSRQAQETLSLDITKDGHIAVYSSPGYGKSTFIQTVVMDLARVHNPERLHIYMLDFGTNGLLPLKKLPHVADTMSIDEEEKIDKFTRIMEAQIKRRKKLLSEYSVASLGMYEKASGLEEPIILIPLDGYDGIKGTKTEAALDKLLLSIAREGAGVGIHLIISAGRQASMRAILYGNIKIQIPLKMIDDGEARNAVGRTQLVVEDQAGRGLIKLEQPEVIQVALPTRGEDALDIIEAIQEEAEEMNANWMGRQPEEIPMVPEVLEFESFKEIKTVQNQVDVGLLPIGLDFEEVEPISIDINRCKNLLLVSDKESSYVKLRKSILDGIVYLSKETKLLLIDPEQTLEEYSDKVETYISRGEKISQFAEKINMEIESRNANGNRETWVIFIDRFDSFLRESKIKESEFTKLFEAAPKVGIHLFIVGYYNYIGTSFEAIAKYVRMNINHAILSMRLMDQSIFEKSYQAKEKPLKSDEGYYLYNGTYIKMKYTN